MRTTFAKATAAVGGSYGYAVKGVDAVYLVVATGDLTFSDKRRPRGCKNQVEPYFTAIVDATTFTKLDDSVGPNPPKEPLSTLGTVLNLTHHG